MHPPAVERTYGKPIESTLMPPLPPSWDGFHPLVVHFPIALLAISPLFVLLAGLTGLRSWMIATLLLMVMGVGGGFVASNTGEAAYDIMEPDEVLDEEGVAYDVAEEHGEQAEFARNIYAIATVLYAIVVVLALAKASTRKLGTRLATHAVTFAVLAWANVLMANAAHLGGELVHLYGVRAQMVAPEEEAEDETAAEEEPADEEPATAELVEPDPADDEPTEGDNASPEASEPAA